MNLQEQSILGNGGKMYVLLVELKKGKEKVTDQLAAGECFAKFIVDTLNRVEGKNYSPVIRKLQFETNTSDLSQQHK